MSNKTANNNIYIYFDLKSTGANSFKITTWEHNKNLKIEFNLNKKEFKLREEIEIRMMMSELLKMKEKERETFLNKLFKTKANYLEVRGDLF